MQVNTVVIGALSRKGGCGKSTALKLIASAMQQSGQKITIIDTDPQGDMTRWWAQARETGNDHENVDFRIAPTDADALYDILDEVEGVSDFVLIDTKGEGSTWLETVAAVSDIALTTVMISRTDYELTLDIRDWFADLMKRAEPGGRLAKHYFLLSRVPPDKALTKTGQEYLDKIIKDLAVLDVEVKDRPLLIDQDALGLLGPMWERLLASENALERGQALNYESLIALGYQITAALLHGKLMEKDPEKRAELKREAAEKKAAERKKAKEEKKAKAKEARAARAKIKAEEARAARAQAKQAGAEAASEPEVSAEAVNEQA